MTIITHQDVSYSIKWHYNGQFLEYFYVLGTAKTSEPCRIQICMYRLDRKSNTGDIYRGFAMSRKMTFGDDFYADFFGRELINGMYVIRAGSEGGKSARN